MRNNEFKENLSDHLCPPDVWVADWHPLRVRHQFVPGRYVTFADGTQKHGYASYYRDQYLETRYGPAYKTRRERSKRIALVTRRVA